MREPRKTWLSGVLATLVIGAVAAVSACTATMPNYDYSKEPDPRNQEYILGIGDQISINVWDNEKLNTDAVIRPDGTVTMPLVGDLHASGQTPSSLKSQIKDKLANFIKLPDVNSITIAVRGANSYRFTVSGEVTRPGVYTSSYYVSVAEAIALAGGFSRFAQRDGLRLNRRDLKTGKTRSIPLSYDLLAGGQHPEMNLVLMAGDSLFIP